MRRLLPFLALLFAMPAFAGDEAFSHDQLLIRAIQAPQPSPADVSAGILKGIASATEARIVVDVEAMLLGAFKIDENTVLKTTDLGFLRDLAALLAFDPDKWPRPDPMNPERSTVSACMCSPDYTVVLYRNQEIIAAIDFCHAAHIRTQEYTDRVEFPELLARGDYYLTKTSAERVRGWEEKNRIKELANLPSQGTQGKASSSSDGSVARRP